MQPEPKKHVSHAIAWSLIALLAGSLVFGIWAYFNQISDIYDNSFTISILHKKTATTKSTTTTTGTTTTDATADWKTYTNDAYGFSIKYPNILDIQNLGNNEEWGAFDSNITNILFGPPASKSGGYIWGVFVNDGEKTSIEKLIADMGDQFSDRREARANIEVDGNDAVLVTVTTSSIPTWISKTVYFTKNENIFSIGNGAIDNKAFNTFYSSFQFTK